MKAKPSGTAQEERGLNDEDEDVFMAERTASAEIRE
jgi:hypothetical protein